MNGMSKERYPREECPEGYVYWIPACAGMTKVRWYGDGVRA